MADMQTLAIGDSFERIEEGILPALTAMLDALLDTTMIAQPGVDAAVHSAELRRMAVELEGLTQLVAGVCEAGAVVEGVGAERSVSAA